MKQIIKEWFKNKLEFRRNPKNKRKVLKSLINAYKYK